MKKVLLGDVVGTWLVDPAFDDPGSTPAAWIMVALYGYSLQVYADFSGYTDMAQGMAGLLGIHLPRNFNFPYRATSPADFWRRWHMSLSQWWRDYVYIPLGGNRTFSSSRGGSCWAWWSGSGRFGRRLEAGLCSLAPCCWRPHGDSCPPQPTTRMATAANVDVGHADWRTCGTERT